MRAFRMVNLNDHASDPAYSVTEIHDDIGYNASARCSPTSTIPPARRR